MGLFDFMSNPQGQSGFSPGTQGLLALSQALLEAGKPSRIPVSGAQAFGGAINTALPAYQSAVARQNIGAALQNNDLSGAMQAMLQSPDPAMQNLALQGKMSMLQPDNQIKMALFRKIIGQQQAAQTSDQAVASSPAQAAQPEQVPVYSTPTSSGNAPASSPPQFDPQTMGLLSLAYPAAANALTEQQKVTYDSPQGKAMSEAGKEAAAQIAQNEQDISLGRVYVANMQKALSADPELGGRSPNDAAPDGALADWKAQWEGNAPEALGGNIPANTAYNKLQSLVIPAAARQSKEAFQRVTGMEFNKMLEAQGSLDQPAATRAAVFKQNMQTTMDNITAKQAENDRLRSQYGLPPSNLPPVNAATQPQASMAATASRPALPPAQAIQMLRANPSLAPQFEQKYGIRAASFLQ